METILIRKWEYGNGIHSAISKDASTQTDKLNGALLSRIKIMFKSKL